MAESNASAVSHKEVKLSDQSPTRLQKRAANAGEEACSGAVQMKLDHIKNMAAKGSGPEEPAASAQVWNTTELLEHIISYLPGKSVVVVSGVNKMAYNCVTNSSIAQSKLFLRPSGRGHDLWLYCEFDRQDPNLPFPQRMLVAQSFEPSMDAFALVKRTGKVSGTARFVFVVALCPLLELEDAQETTALGRLKRKGWQDDERANLIGLPAENSRYADMVLTDPPVNEIWIRFTYKHSIWPSLLIRVERYVKSKVGPLTVGAVLREARTKPGDTFLFEPPMPSNNYCASHACIPRSNVNDVILQAVQEHGGGFALDVKKSQFIFRNPRIVVPNSEERVEMEANRTE